MSNGPLRTIDQTPTLADVFDEIETRVVRIHYAVASGPREPRDRGSQLELDRWVIERLNDLLRYVEAAEARTLTERQSSRASTRTP